jgi:hypothetical protein
VPCRNCTRVKVQDRNWDSRMIRSSQPYLQKFPLPSKRREIGEREILGLDYKIVLHIYVIFKQ